MRPSDYDSLDEFIDAALKSEPVRRVPFEVQRSIQHRVERLAQAQRERRQFRLRAAVSCALFTLVAAVAFTLGTAGDIAHTLASTIPGAKGYYDAFAVAAAQWFVPASLTALAAIAGVVAIAVLAENRTLKMRRATV